MAAAGVRKKRKRKGEGRDMIHHGTLTLID